MKSLVPFVLILLVFAAASSSLAETYSIDASHSRVGFKVRHFLSEVTGSFGTFSGSLAFDQAHPENSRVSVHITVSSINTGIAARDNDLRSSGFFDVARYPTMMFQSSMVKPIRERQFEVAGDLTMHGVTRPVLLKVSLVTPLNQASATTDTDWVATSSLRRSEFGLKWNGIIEASQAVGDDITIELRIHAVPDRGI